MSLDAIGIVSEDLAKSIHFYSLLGINLQQEGGPDHLEATTSSGVRIMVDSEDLMRKINPNWKKTIGSAIVLCFKQNSPISVNEIYNNILEAGFNNCKAPWNAFWGQRYASVFDPDGNQIDLFAPLDS